MLAPPSSSSRKTSTRPVVAASNSWCDHMARQNDTMFDNEEAKRQAQTRRTKNDKQSFSISYLCQDHVLTPSYLEIRRRDCRLGGIRAAFDSLWRALINIAVAVIETGLGGAALIEPHARSRTSETGGRGGGLGDRLHG
jgi:hypothetical protein